MNNNPFAVQFFQANTHIKKEQWFKTIMEHFYNLYKGRTIDKNELNHVNKNYPSCKITNDPFGQVEYINDYIKYFVAGYRAATK